MQRRNKALYLAMAVQISSPVGLIAGNGTFPLEFADSAREKGITVFAVAHRGETDERIEQAVAQCLWVRVGELGRVLKAFERWGVRQVAFAGGITRVKLFGGVKLDWQGIRLISRIRSIRDDAILRGVAQEIERKGISVISAGVLLEKSVPQAGWLSRRALTKDEMRSAAVGWQAAKAIGTHDIGQTVVVNQGVVVAVEAVEGTDSTIRRGGELAGKGSVVVKASKPGQDLRIDLPTVGLATIENMKNTGATALVLEAGKTIVLKPQEFVEAANAAGIAVLVVAGMEELKL